MEDGLRDGTWTYSYEDKTWTNMEEGSGPTTPTTPNGLVFDPLLIAVALPTIAAVIIVVLVIRRRN